MFTQDEQVIGRCIFSVFEGEFSDDLKNGHGTMRWRDGRVFEGEFFNDVRVEGKMTYPSGLYLAYDGEWSNNLYEGVGELSLSRE